MPFFFPQNSSDDDSSSSGVDVQRNTVVKALQHSGLQELHPIQKKEKKVKVSSSPLRVNIPVPYVGEAFNTNNTILIVKHCDENVLF